MSDQSPKIHNDFAGKKEITSFNISQTSTYVIGRGVKGMVEQKISEESEASLETFMVDYNFDGLLNQAQAETPDDARLTSNLEALRSEVGHGDRADVKSAREILHEIETISPAIFMKTIDWLVSSDAPRSLQIAAKQMLSK